MATTLTGKVSLVTGATSGIGKATAEGLARLGATVVLVARDRTKGEATKAEIIAKTGNTNVDLLLADLSSQASIRQLAAAFKARYDRLDILINNAGGVFPKRSLTVDGHEYTFAFNHLAYFLLTDLLLDLLKASTPPGGNLLRGPNGNVLGGSPPARIINVTSMFGAGATINLDDLHLQSGYTGIKAYSQSKLCNMLFTYELARRLEGTGVTVNCVHPGVVRTNFGNTSAFFRIMGLIARPFMLTPERSAERLLYLAASPAVEGVTGRYFGKQVEMRSPRQTYDEGVAQKLWAISAQLTGL
ncbi:MAG TPA: SDR family oxidoreductase [Symbiobacteriaceae bacterium]|nr:SDR family oxidoreductase [Symbiobacteriaceae bacterium]